MTNLELDYQALEKMNTHLNRVIEYQKEKIRILEEKIKILEKRDWQTPINIIYYNCREEGQEMLSLEKWIADKMKEQKEKENEKKDWQMRLGVL